jgi:hypothetical protein
MDLIISIGPMDPIPKQHTPLSRTPSTGLLLSPKSQPRFRSDLPLPTRSNDAQFNNTQCFYPLLLLSKTTRNLRRLPRPLSPVALEGALRSTTLLRQPPRLNLALSPLLDHPHHLFQYLASLNLDPPPLPSPLNCLTRPQARRAKSRSRPPPRPCRLLAPVSLHSNLLSEPSSLLPSLPNQLLALALSRTQIHPLPSRPPSLLPPNSLLTPSPTHPSYPNLLP